MQVIRTPSCVDLLPGGGPWPQGAPAEGTT
jgi:hypothetical protein